MYRRGGAIPSDWKYEIQRNDIRTLYSYNATTGGGVVEVPSDRTELQNYNLSKNDSSETLPFYGHWTIASVNLNSVPFRNNDASRAFQGCWQLEDVTGINESVTNMFRTFSSCSNLNQNIQIPNSVTNMWGTFQSCSNLNQNIQIPNSVTDMGATFFSCSNLNQNIQIPNSVTSMSQTFQYCDNLNQNIQIPNSVTNMYYTFNSCFNLNQNIQIPNSVTSMFGTFHECRKFDQDIQIPSSVTNLASTFWNCKSLSYRRINILGTEVTDTKNCFGMTDSSKDVYIPYKYSNGVYTKTYNAFQAAGYFNNINGVTLHDLNLEA